MLKPENAALLKWYNRNYLADSRVRKLVSDESERYYMHNDRGACALVVEDYGNNTSMYILKYSGGWSDRCTFDDATAAGNELFKRGFRE